MNTYRDYEIELELIKSGYRLHLIVAAPSANEALADAMKMMREGCNMLVNADYDSDIRVTEVVVTAAHPQVTA